ncbi:MAG: acyl-CoA dehydrogenase family protein [Pseudomonadota bacterium]|jgi:alkylation response protein AidB-like acyl-CoA dehydrogenase
MDIELSPDDEAFRQEVRAFIRAHLPPELARRGREGYHSHPDAVRRWTRILNAQGWAAFHWPKQHGGVDWSPLQRHLFDIELRAAGAPLLQQTGFELVGPVLYTFGTEAQQARYLPAIRNADEFWCQGFSEPNSGSDLASLKTRAVRDGDVYVVNGQKTWTSEGHKAQMMFALVRTDAEAKPQAGISFLLIDMASPGVTVRPIYTLDEGLSVNEVFFDEVRVPAENLVGEENRGWSYAKFLLTNERAMSAETPHTRADLEQLRDLAARELRHGRPILDDPLFAAKLARFEVDLMALEAAVLRVLHMAEDDPALTSVASVLKLRGAELRQRVADLAVEALGDIGLAVYPDEGAPRVDPATPKPPAPDHAAGWLAKATFRRATTIYGGANEIQRNIIAKAVLGL